MTYTIKHMQIIDLFDDDIDHKALYDSIKAFNKPTLRLKDCNIINTNLNGTCSIKKQDGKYFFEDLEINEKSFIINTFFCHPLSKDSIGQMNKDDLEFDGEFLK